MSIKKRAKKLIRDIRDWKKSNRPFKNYNFLTPEYKKKQEKRQKQLIASVYETKKEKKLWNRYLKSVNESFKDDNPHRKFTLRQVYDLGIDFQILFLYSKKDVGKTRQLGVELTNIRARDPKAQVVFIRNTKEELEGFKLTMNDSEHWPTYSNGEYVYWKDDIKKKGTKRAKPCGFMAYTSGLGFIKWQGSEFKNVKFWMWDECNSVEGGLTEAVFNSLNVFLSSIIRDKSDVKGFMFGNLLAGNNIFLNRLGVGSRTNLKLFDVHEDGDRNKPLLSKLLYLNTGDLFQGIEKQKGLATQFLNDEEALALHTNQPGLFETKSQYEETDLKNYYPVFSFVFRKPIETIGKRMKKGDFILYLYKIPNCLRYVCWIDFFNPELLKKGFDYFFCYQKEVANNYQMTIIQEKEDFGESFIEPLGEILDNGELWFGWNNTKVIFEEMWQAWETKFLTKNTTTI